MQQYGIFWGCQIPARFPFIEKATRILFSELGIDIVDYEGFTCCPEKSMAKKIDSYTWLVTAARNLALAESQGCEVLINPCNGCYSTFRVAANEMTCDPALKARVNRDLEKVGLHYKGDIQIKHIVEFLYDDVGTHKIAEHIKTPLTGLRFAVHHGCHMLRPSPAINFDDPDNPVKFDALVSVAGGISPKHGSKMLCCGESYSRGDETELAPTLIRSKFLDFKKENIDAVCVACPACFLQLDTQQLLMQRKGEEFHFPVLYVTEMLCLAMGVDLEVLGLDMHRIKFDRFFASSKERKSAWEKMESTFNMDALRRCYDCGACENDCPSALNTAQFKPNELIGKVVRGEIEELISSAEIWKCLECHTCLDLCPQRFGMEKVFSVLKEMAVEKKLAPATVKAMMETFISTSKLGEPQKTLRKKLDLPEAKDSGVEDWKKLMETIEQ